MKPKFKNAVDGGDLETVRLFLANELMLDPRGVSFREMLTYAEASFAGSLYDADNGETYTTDENMWNEDLLFKIKNELDYNFSKERLLTYESMAKIVLKEKAQLLDQEKVNKDRNTSSEAANDSEGRQTDETNDGDMFKWIIGGIAAVGALILTWLLKKD